jgi:curved DNA-binding protein CbpA
MATQLIDPYVILDIGPGATTSQVRAAYRRLAKRYHPDLHADAGAADQMRRINQAWEMLSSPSRRAQYDAGRALRSAAGNGHWAGVPRGAPADAGASQPWATGAGPAVYPRPRTYGRAPAYAGAYSDMGSDRRPGVLGWGSLLLLLPVAIVSVALLSSGILPFPLFGLLLFGVVSRLVGRNR